MYRFQVSQSLTHHTSSIGTQWILDFLDLIYLDVNSEPYASPARSDTWAPFSPRASSSPLCGLRGKWTSSSPFPSPVTHTKEAVVLGLWSPWTHRPENRKASESLEENGGERESVRGVISWPIKQTPVSRPHVMREADTQGLVSQHMNLGKEDFLTYVMMQR